MAAEAEDRRPLVSIVTPSYNQGEFIRETIESVLNQTYDRLEYIIVDGGSTDDSVDIIRSYSDRLTWVSEPDEGQSDAINKGFRMSRGNILTWLNSDDQMAGPEVVERVADRFSSSPELDILYGDFEVIGARGEHLFTRKQAPFNAHVMLFANNFIVPSAFFRRELLDTVGYLDVQLPWVMDLDYWLRALEAGARFHADPAPMWKHRFHPSSNTVGGRREMRREFLEIQRKYQPDWFKRGGWFPFAVHKTYAGVLRVWTQTKKMVARGHVDNLPYSYYVRRFYNPDSDE